MVIKEKIAEKNMSIAKFGRDIGVDRFKARRIASGERFKYTRKLLHEIYRVLKVTPNDIFGIPDEKVATDATKPIDKSIGKDDE